MSAEPGDERVCDGVLPFGLGAVVAAEGKGHGGAAAGDSGEALFEEFRDGLGEGVFVAAGHSAVVEDVFFEGVDPVVDDFSEGAGRLGGGGEAFGEPPVDGFEPVQRGFGFGDLDFGDGEAGAFGAFGEPAGEEGFSEPYSPRTALKLALPAPTAASSSSSTVSYRSSPTANRSRPFWGTVPRRSASRTSRRRAALTVFT